MAVFLGAGQILSLFRILTYWGGWTNKRGTAIAEGSTRCASDGGCFFLSVAIPARILQERNNEQYPHFQRRFSGT